MLQSSYIEYLCQLDPSSLTPLSVAGCNRLQLVVTYCDTSLHWRKYVTIIDTTNSAGRFSSGRLLTNKVISLFISSFYNYCEIYPEWPHRQGGCLACWRLQGCKIESRLRLSCTDLYKALGAQVVLPMRVGGATSQLDIPSLTTLSVPGCGRLQLGVPHWAAPVDYFK